VIGFFALRFTGKPQVDDLFLTTALSSVQVALSVFLTPTPRERKTSVRRAAT